MASDSICANQLSVSVIRVEAQAEPRFHLVTFQVNDRRFVTGVDSADDHGALCKALADALQGDVIGYERIQWPDCPEQGHHHLLEMTATGQWQCPTGPFTRNAGELCS